MSSELAKSSSAGPGRRRGYSNQTPGDTSHLEQFRAFAAGLGYELPQNIEPGRRFRFSANGKRADDAGWGTLFADGEGGVIGDWRTGAKHVWQARRDRTLSPDESREWQAKIERERREAEAEQERGYIEAQKRAHAIFNEAKPAADDHPYLARKAVKAHGLKVYRGDLAIADAPCDGALIVPMRDAQGAVWSLQFISPGEDKKYLPGGRVKGCYFGIGSAPKGEQALCIAEGYATAASIHAATGYPVVVAFDAGNLPAVATALRQKYPQVRIIVCGDDDYRTPGNPGLTKATEAARAMGAMLAVPDFGTDRPGGATDFNDLAQAKGAEAVKRAVETARAPDAASRRADSPAVSAAPVQAPDGWQEPLPLVAKVAPEPYPLDALPNSIRAAVEEVQGFTKAPVPLVASSALAALSLAIQAHADVRRSEQLSGPSSLFLLTIADSGERKSTCDGFFTSAIRGYEQQQAEAAKPAMSRYEADLEAWTAKRDGIKAKIRDQAKAEKPTERQEAALRELECEKPTPPRVPKLLRGDETPENLAFVLAHDWPSAGIASSEAGAIFGAHGMGKDSIMRNLSLLNILWENGTLSIGRRTSESFTVRGARLTVALQVQEATLRSFFDRSQGLARGSGFLARFLVAWPQSTQGYRHFTEAPQAWPALAAFNRRIAAILDQAAPITEEGTLSPAVLSLTPDAKAAWIAFHDAIEAELGTGGELYDVRDVASKTADNAARLAALFQIFQHGMGAAVGPECFAGASRIAAWHLNEARRFFGELALPVELANAGRLDSWLIDYCRRGRTHVVPRREVQRCGPNGLRAKAALTEALRELAEAGRIREVHEARRKDILVNPALLAGSGA
jgi:putative DNA primase/helicase